VAWDRAVTSVYSCNPGSIAQVSGPGVNIVSEVASFSAPQQLSLGLLAFHPTLPVVCQLADARPHEAATPPYATYLLCFLLTSNDLPLLDKCEIEAAIEPEFFGVSRTTGEVLVAPRQGDVTLASIRRYAFRADWTRRLRFGSPLIGHVPNPMRFFVEGDKGAAWPASVSLHPLYCFGEREHSTPIDLAHTVCLIAKPGEATSFKVICFLHYHSLMRMDIYLRCQSCSLSVRCLRQNTAFGPRSPPNSVCFPGRLSTPAQ